MKRKQSWFIVAGLQSQTYMTNLCMCTAMHIKFYNLIFLLSGYVDYLNLRPQQFDLFKKNIMLRFTIM